MRRFSKPTLRVLYYWKNENVAPAIKTAMAPYFKDNKFVFMTRILKLGGKEYNDLLAVEGYNGTRGMKDYVTILPSQSVETHTAKNSTCSDRNVSVDFYKHTQRFWVRGSRNGEQQMKPQRRPWEMTTQAIKRNIKKKRRKRRP